MKKGFGVILFLTFFASWFFLTGPVAGGMPDEVAKRLVDLNACLEFLESSDNLVRVKSEVDPEYELAGIAKEFEGRELRWDPWEEQVKKVKE